MTTITGTVESIEYKNEMGHEKKVVTLVPDHRQKLFVQFHKNEIALLNNIGVNDAVAIEVLFNGKLSKNSGYPHNNIEARNIKKL